jgi:hypothetical protein
MGKRKRKSDAAASPALEDENSALDGSENLGPDGMPKVGNCKTDSRSFIAATQLPSKSTRESILGS